MLDDPHHHYAAVPRVHAGSAGLARGQQGKGIPARPSMALPAHALTTTLCLSPCTTKATSHSPARALWICFSSCTAPMLGRGPWWWRWGPGLGFSGVHGARTADLAHACPLVILRRCFAASLQAASLGARVVALEPQHALASLLRTSAALNRFDVTVLQVRAWGCVLACDWRLAEPPTCTQRGVGPSAALDLLRHEHGAAAPQAQVMRVQTLDDALLEVLGTLQQVHVLRVASHGDVMQVLNGASVRARTATRPALPHRATHRGAPRL